MEPAKIEHDLVIRTAVVGLFVLACIYSLFFAAEFFMPMMIALLLHLVLQPVMRFFGRVGFSPSAAALVIVLGIVSALVVAAAYLLAPIDQWVRELPHVSRTIQEKVALLREPIDLFLDASKEVEEITEDKSDGKIEVVVQEGSSISKVLSSLQVITWQIFTTIFLLFFLLAYTGELMDRAIELLRTRRDKRELRELVGTVEKVLSKYLATITLINIILGVAISACMFAIGMPTFYLWGAMATVLNFIPYLGSAIGVLIVAIVALVTFDSALYALLAPLLYLVCTTIEGQFATPAVLGRSLSLNPIFIFVSVGFWAWIWGPLGALMAVPILIVMKVIADHVDSLKPLGHILGREPLNSVVKPPAVTRSASSAE